MPNPVSHPVSLASPSVHVVSHEPAASPLSIRRSSSQPSLGHIGRRASLDLGSSVIRRSASFQDLPTDSKVWIETPSAFKGTVFDTPEPKLDMVFRVASSYLNPNASNAWEPPKKKGLMVHEAGLEVYQNIFEGYVQKLTNISEKDMPKLRWIRQAYGALHDVGKAWQGFKPIENGDHQSKFILKNKGIETIATDVVRTKVILDRDLNSHQQLADFAKENPSFLLGDVSPPAFQDALRSQADQLTHHTGAELLESSEGWGHFESKVKKELKGELKKELASIRKSVLSEIDEKISETSQNQLHLFSTVSVLLSDNIGLDLQAYAGATSDAEKKEIIENIRKGIHESYDSLPRPVRSDVTLKQFTALRLSNFLSDIAYYGNLKAVYFDDQLKPFPHFDQLFQMMVDPEKEFPETMPRADLGIMLNEQKPLSSPSAWFWYSPSKPDSKMLYPLGVAHAKTNVLALAITTSINALMESVNKVSGDIPREPYKVWIDESGTSRKQSLESIANQTRFNMLSILLVDKKDSFSAIMRAYVGKDTFGSGSV
jgi:hypothetical protein